MWILTSPMPMIVCYFETRLELCSLALARSSALEVKSEEPIYAGSLALVLMYFN